jgi:predicted O-methyltransferase YrrM
VLLKETPVIEKIYKGIFDKMMTNEVCFLNQLNNLYKNCKKSNYKLTSPIKYTSVSPLIKVFCREEFADLIRVYDFKVGVELGVATGRYSLHLLNNSNINKLYCIDKWDDHHTVEEMESAKKRMETHKDRVIFMRSTFKDALNKFPDGFFDFIYIDGYAHTGQDAGETLRDWYPKLREGGLFAGHDYDMAYPKTIEEVDKFTESIGKDFFVTDEVKLPSWYFLK